MSTFVELVGCPLPPSGRIAGIWLEVCAQDPCPWHAWHFPKQEHTEGPEQDSVYIRLQEPANDALLARCVNLDDGYGTRMSVPLEMPPDTYLPEFPLSIGWALALLLLARLSRSS